MIPKKFLVNVFSFSATEWTFYWEKKFNLISNSSMIKISQRSDKKIQIQHGDGTFNSKINLIIVSKSAAKLKFSKFLKKNTASAFSSISDIHKITNRRQREIQSAKLCTCKQKQLEMFSHLNSILQPNISYKNSYL